MTQQTRSRTAGAGKGRRINTRWRDHFLEHLAQTSNVTKSAEAAGVAASTAYKARTNETEFARRWMTALWEGYAHLEMEVLRRLREGEQKTNDGEKYDFANAIRLLSAHRDNAARAQAEQRNVSAGEVRASIDRKVEEIRLKVLEEKAKDNRGR
ncbi:MAG: hypothetical protein ABJ242_04930 [Marinomonas sp.]